LTDNALNIGKRADNGMKRRDIAKAGRCQRDKTELDDRTVGLSMRAACNIRERIRREMPDQPVQSGKHQPDIQIEGDRNIADFLTSLSAIENSGITTPNPCP
jgi:hypothetical protein